DQIALTEQEEYMLDALRIISPDIQRVSFIGEANSRKGRIPIVKMRDVEEPLPLRSRGDGLNRLFGIMLALVNARDGILLVDEFENGLHYSVQTEVWRHLFEVAGRLNVQVFATTHSWDCIEAFQKAAQENEKEEGVLVRLQEKKGVVKDTV